MSKLADIFLNDGYRLKAARDGWVVLKTTDRDKYHAIGNAPRIAGALEIVYEDRLLFSGATTYGDLLTAMHAASTPDNQTPQREVLDAWLDEAHRLLGEGEK